MRLSKDETDFVRDLHFRLLKRMNCHEGVAIFPEGAVGCLLDAIGCVFSCRSTALSSRFDVKPTFTQSNEAGSGLCEFGEDQYGVVRILPY